MPRPLSDIQWHVSYAPDKLSDMESTVTVRRLQRETSAVLHEVETGEHPVIVTRDNEEIAKIVPLGSAERRWRRWVRELGGDPDDPAWQRTADSRPLPGTGGQGLSDHLARLREAER